MRHSYIRELSRQHKGLLLFLLDQSCSMQESSGGMSNRKMDNLAYAINSMISNLCLKVAGAEGVRDLLDIGVLGYKTDTSGNNVIASAFLPAVRHHEDTNGLVSIVHLSANCEITERVQQIVDEETGETVEIPVRLPVWVEPKAEGDRPMCHALVRAAVALDAWIDRYPNSFPPIIFNFTGGESTDKGNPVEYAEVIKKRATSDGNVLLFNCSLSSEKADPILFPNSMNSLPNRLAKTLFAMSSELPQRTWRGLPSGSQDIKTGARGFAQTGDLVSLVSFINELLFPSCIQRDYLR